MHPEFSRQMLEDHVSALRQEAKAARRARIARRHLRNPRHRAAA
jgi:hypothetical protein